MNIRLIENGAQTAAGGRGGARAARRCSSVSGRAPAPASQLNTTSQRYDTITKTINFRFLHITNHNVIHITIILITIGRNKRHAYMYSRSRAAVRADRRARVELSGIAVCVVLMLQGN